MTWTRSQRRCAWPWSQTKNLRRGITLAGLVLGGLLHSAAQTPSHGGVNDPNTKDLGRAQRLLEQHHLQEARAVLNNIVETHASADAYLLLADVAREQNDLAVTMSALRRAAKLDPQREDAYLEFSQICGDHGNGQLALDSAEVGLANIPGSYRLKIQKGVALDMLGRFDDSIGILKEAAAQQAENSLATLSLAVVLTHADRLEEADRLLAQGTQRYPQDASMHYFRGKLLLQLASASNGGDNLRTRARQEFTEALQFNPAHADAWYQLATLYSPDEQPQAEAALHRCLKLNPDHAPAQYALARLYVRNGKRAEGEAMLARYKADQRAAELQQNKQLRIDVAGR